MTPTPIPADFPQTAPPGAVPGFQPKLLVREEDDRFVVEPDEHSVHARYVMCEDLAHQLVVYGARKRNEDPGQSETQLREKVARAVRQKAFGWGLSPAEAEWVLGRIDSLALDADRKDNP